MYPIFVEASGNITEAALSPTGKEQVTMKRIRKKFRDMKYRHKLTILLVTSSLVPMTMLALYSHNSMSSWCAIMKWRIPHPSWNRPEKVLTARSKYIQD